MGTKLQDLHRDWSRDAEYREAYDARAAQYDLAQRLIAARATAGLTQAEVAARMGTKQSAISRIESGRNISVEKLREYARAIGREVWIELG